MLHSNWSIKQVIAFDWLKFKLVYVKLAYCASVNEVSSRILHTRFEDGATKWSYVSIQVGREKLIIKNFMDFTK